VGHRLVTPRPGKGRRRGTVLTDNGRRMLTLLRESRDRVSRSVEERSTGPTRKEIVTRSRSVRRPAQ
jgi:molybdenum-dependent DNA-binding transcriptional regulator ModE